MSKELLIAAGGLGLFLLGMTLLTEGLRGLAGRSLRRALTRFTKTPTSGAVTGALATALIQSSSATTVTAVGFVGAGLLTFTQALGIIYGANVGTTLTGWMVALIGFKLDLGTFAMPLILIGVLMRLFGRGRLRQGGTALAGFSLLFIGIDAMQEGLSFLEGVVTPADFPDDSLWGRLQLVAIGVGITLVTQSSSAGIAAALVALSSGTISFPQAAAMVIGMDVGTTFTAFLATLGGGVGTRRTGYAHVIYNLLTGCLAFTLLDVYVDQVSPWLGAGADGDPQVAVVAFHTTFNLLGVILVLPFAGAFARLIMWLVPDQDQASSECLDPHLLKDADAAIDAAARALADVAEQAFALVRRRLGDTDGPDMAQDLSDFEAELEAVQSYVERIPGDEVEVQSPRRAALIHVLDHLARLGARLELPAGLEMLREDPHLRREGDALCDLLPADDLPVAVEEAIPLKEAADRLADGRHAYRRRTVDSAAPGSGASILLRLDAYRWIERSARHGERILFHLGRAFEQA